MKLFNSGYFTYKDNQLYCEEVNLKSITDKVGTPVYVYSKKFFEDRYKQFDFAFDEIDHTVFFAVKSNFNLNTIKIFSNLGSGIDVNSEGELFRALEAGVSTDKIILTGVGKTEREIKIGLESNVKFIKAESLEEIHLINKIAKKLNVVAPLAIRINPDVDPKTHPYISTGLAENKFGIDSTQAINVFTEASKLSNLKPVGIDMHIGSQITELSPFIEAVTKLANIFTELKSKNIDLTHFDIGGGMGVVYHEEQPFTPDELAQALLPILKPLNCNISFEPGRYLTANGGVLLTEVLYTKMNHDKNFIIVDASMTDLLRPSLYGAYHHIQPVMLNNREDIIADIVGPVCESGDFLAKGREISKCEAGNKLAVMSAGAYGMVMASNYNGRRRPAEVIVDKDKFYIARSRETYEHLLYDEKIIPELF